jgi:hypothetical protein
MGIFWLIVLEVSVQSADFIVWLEMKQGVMGTRRYGTGGCLPRLMSGSKEPEIKFWGQNASFKDIP